MTVTTILTAILIGVISGVVAALCGVGGGVVMVPAFVALLGIPQKQAVATSLAIIIPTALTATIQNGRAGLVNWPLVGVTMVSSSILAYFGAGWLKSMSNDMLTKIFGAVLVLAGLRMLLVK